jgi:hypothetical protein
VPPPTAAEAARTLVFSADDKELVRLPVEPIADREINVIRP